MPIWLEIHISDYVDEYESYVQWMPREMIEDVMFLAFNDISNTKLRDRPIVLEAVRVNGMALQYYHGDREIILESFNSGSRTLMGVFY